MSLRLYAVNLWLRLLVKPMLARMKTPQAARRRFERDARHLFPTPPGAHFADTMIRRDDGTQMPALWASCDRPDRRTVILFLHGGAFLAGSSRTHRHLAAAIASAASARALVPDYRLAPEDPFPAAIEDALAAYRHLLEAGYDPGRIAIAGDSAGGGLTFGMVQALPDAGLPQPAALVGFSPFADMTGQADSLRRNAARDVMLPVKRLDEVVGYYMGEHDPTDPRASPALASWWNPPPALIMASRSEILVDDARTLAEALRAGGGSVQLELWRHLPHAWPILAGRLPEADAAIERAGGFLARHIGAETIPEAA